MKRIISLIIILSLFLSLASCQKPRDFEDAYIEPDSSPAIGDNEPVEKPDEESASTKPEEEDTSTKPEEENTSTKPEEESASTKPPATEKEPPTEDDVTKLPQKDQSPAEDTPTQKDFIFGYADIDSIGFKTDFKYQGGLCTDIPLLDTVLLHDTATDIPLTDELKADIVQNVFKKYQLLRMPTFVLNDRPYFSEAVYYLNQMGMDLSSIEKANESAAAIFGHQNIITEQFSLYPASDDSNDYKNLKVSSITQYKTADERTVYRIIYNDRVLSYIAKDIYQPEFFVEHIHYSNNTSTFADTDSRAILVDLTQLKNTCYVSVDGFPEYQDVSAYINAHVAKGGALVRFKRAGNSLGYVDAEGKLQEHYDTPIKILEVYNGGLKKGDVVSLCEYGKLNDKNELVITDSNTYNSSRIDANSEYVALLIYSDYYSGDDFLAFSGSTLRSKTTAIKEDVRNYIDSLKK